MRNESPGNSNETELAVSLNHIVPKKRRRISENNQEVQEDEYDEIYVTSSKVFIQNI